MFLTEKDFLKQIGALHHELDSKYFAKQLWILYKKPITVEEFLLEGQKKEDDKRFENPREWLSFFYNVLVTRRVEVLHRFYTSYLYSAKIENLFYEPLFEESLEQLEESLLDESEKTIFVQRKDKTKRILRNLYAKEILRDTTITNSIQGKPNFWNSLVDFFQGRLDDRLFAPSSIQLYLRDKTTQTPIYLLQQYQSKASILNPAVLHLLFETKLNNKDHKNKKIFTPEMSWSSYLLNYLSSSEDWNEYIGVDVMNSVIEKSYYLYDLFKKRNPSSKKKTTLLKTPSESLYYDKNFLKKYGNSIDSIMYCPPYYDMEIYPDSSGNQSIDKYPNYQIWLNNYFYKTLDVCSILLKKGGKMGIIIGNYHKKLNGEFYDLVGDFEHYIKCQKELIFKDQYFLKNRTSPLKNNDKLRGEIFYLFVKG